MKGNGTPLSVYEQMGYAAGMLGWSVLTNIITVMLIYFYVPPSNANLPDLVPQVTILGIISLLSVVVASGRLLDAVTDPLIAFLSDRSQHPGGRRLPFMRWALFPAVLFSVLFFVPLTPEASTGNLWWLVFIQSGFYVSVTAYIIPYNALLPELAADPRAKVRLSAWLSLTFVMGIIISSQTPLLADWLQEHFLIVQRQQAFQWSIALLSGVAAFFMAVPLFVIDERRHCRHSRPATIPISRALWQTLQQRNFRIFIVADFAYFVCLTIISSGMLYFLSVLLGLPEAIGGQVMGTMVLVSLLFYPIVIRLADTYGKRRPMLFALFLLGSLLFGIFFLGKLPLAPKVQIFGFAVLTALPMAFLGILPYAIIADIADADGQQTGQQKEGMFFAVRNFTVKLGQTIGIMTFAILTLFGKDPGNDWGIRVTGLFGGVLCILAGIIFTRFREQHPAGKQKSQPGPPATTNPGVGSQE